MQSPCLVAFIYKVMKNSLFILLWGFCTIVRAQIPVEIFVGDKHTTVDILFFKYFKNNQKENSAWLFFNRNRASMDYRMNQTNYLPQFGFTEALSFNPPGLKGFAPVFVGQVLSHGVYPKAGVQYAYIKNEISLFTWLVCETLNRPDIDYFLLFRYTPTISQSLVLFTQLESVNAIPTSALKTYRFTQRLRLGLSVGNFQMGVGADFQQSGRGHFNSRSNIGGFIRHVF